MLSDRRYALERANEAFGHKPASAGVGEAFIVALVMTVAVAMMKWM